MIFIKNIGMEYTDCDIPLFFVGIPFLIHNSATLKFVHIIILSNRSGVMITSNKLLGDSQ